MTLTERRARFVYEAARLAAEAAEAPIVPVPWDEREEAFKRQFLEVIERQCGDQRSRSPEELHGTWMQSYFAMGWVYGPEYSREAKFHPDLVPYEELGQLEKDKDEVFMALCEIARQWIYETIGQSITGKCCSEPKLAKQMGLEYKTDHAFALVIEVLEAVRDGKPLDRSLNMLQDFVAKYWSMETSEVPAVKD